MSKRRPQIDFAKINRVAILHMEEICRRWLPDGRRHGREWVVRNPRRTDNRPGSFSISLKTGQWADFATVERGGDPISLAAYLAGVRQSEAARLLADMLGVRDYD